jgi:hypothetical protein
MGYRRKPLNDVAREVPMRCSKCGTQLLDAAEFCVNCGAARGSTPEPAGEVRRYGYGDKEKDKVEGEVRRYGYRERVKELSRSMLGGPAGGAASRADQTTGAATAQIGDISYKRKTDALIVNAGLGGAFGLLIGTAVLNFIGLSTADKARELFAIAVEALVVIKFIEPIAEYIREALHIAYAEPLPPQRSSIKVYALLIVAGISLADGMVHSLLKDREEAPGLIIGYTVSGLIPAGITYFWLRGARSWPSRARLYGPVSALVIALTYMGLLLLITRRADIAPSIIPSTVYWTLVAFAGGLAIDKGWGRDPTTGILISTVACSVLVDLAFDIYYLSNGATIMQLFKELIFEAARTAGWAVALMLYPTANSLFAPARAPITEPGISGTFSS